MKENNPESHKNCQLKELSSDDYPPEEPVFESTISYSGSFTLGKSRLAYLAAGTIDPDETLIKLIEKQVGKNAPVEFKDRVIVTAFCRDDDTMRKYTRLLADLEHRYVRIGSIKQLPLTD